MVRPYKVEGRTRRTRRTRRGRRLESGERGGAGLLLIGWGKGVVEGGGGVGDFIPVVGG